MGQDKTLKNLQFKRRYDPCVDGTDVIKDIYIPCLSNSVRYDRIAAYFNSAVLQLYAAGLVELYKNKGHARYIFSCETNDIDLSTIASAYRDKMDSLADGLEDTMIDDYNVANLSYLIKHNLAEIKIAFMISGKASIMHIKQGIFEDADGYKVCFDGSGNETPSGLKENCEIFKVYTNFDGDNPDIDDAEELFRKMWDNTYSPGRVYAVTPEGLLFEKLCSYSKERLFNSQEEYNEVLYNGKILVDINIDDSLIFVYDYTNDKSFSYPSGIKSRFGSRITETLPNVYVIRGLTLIDIRDTIPGIAKKYGEGICYTKRAQDYIDEQNLNIEMRIKLGTAIKQRDFNDVWAKNYEFFKEVVNHETIIPLKEEQMLNAFHHYAMKSSMDFSVPGTGKTYISYGLFAYLNSTYGGKEKEVNHLVVLGPLNCFRAWKEECKNLFGKRYTIFDCSESENVAIDLLEHRYHIYLINYEFFGKEKNAELVSRLIIDNKTFVVFDEIHRIKNTKGVRAGNVIKAFLAAVRKPIYKLALTGTPLPNSFVDLLNYVKILYQDDLSGFLHPLSEHNLKLADTQPNKAGEVRDNLYPLYTRTTKNDLGVPPANANDVETLKVVPTNDEEELYKYVYKSYQDSNTIVRYVRAIQAASNPRLLLNAIDKKEIEAFIGEGVALDDNVYSFDSSTMYLEEIRGLVNKIGVASKTKATIDFVEKSVNEGKKIIVWCLFIDTINFVSHELRKRGVDVATITGSDSLPDRNAKIDAFKYGSVNVIVTNPNTLAESVSLHTVCHDAVYLEYGFNLTYMLQSKDRIHRVGLPEGTETNYYYATVNSNSFSGEIDKIVYDRLEQKETRMKQAIESNDLIVLPTGNDLDDIRFILNEMDKKIGNKN